MNNSQTAIFFIKCTQIASACLMLLTVSCAKRNDQYGTKHKLTQDQQQQNMIYSKYSPKRIKFTPQDQYNKLLELLDDEKLEDFIDLLRFVPDINFTDNNDQTLLHYAVQNGKLDILQELLKQKNIFIDYADKKGCTALHYAAQNGKLDILQELLKQKNIFINYADKKGCTALHYAVQNGKLDILQELLNEENININYKDNQDWTALHYAVKHNQLNIITELLNKNANIYTKSKDGMTRIDIAKINNNPDIESMLLKKHNNIIQSFHKAIRANNLKQVQKLLSQGCDVNAPDINGMTPLILATKFGYWNIFQELLKVEGINIYHTDNQGFDAFYYAGIAKHCYPSFYNLLEEQKNKKEHRKA